MKKVDLVHLTLLLIFISTFLLKFMNFYPLIYKPLLGVYLLLIPGALLLALMKEIKILNLHFFLYSIGLSIAIIEITGVLTNFILLFFHINRPLSEYYIMWSFILVVFILITVSWIISRRQYSEPKIIELLRISSLSKLNFILVLVLVLLMTITASFILNEYGIIVPSYITFLCIMALVIMTLKFPPEIYPALAFFMSLTLLYHTSLVSGYLWGRDIFNEFYIVNLVIKNGKWIPSIINDPLNSALSITILPVYFSNILDISVVYVFKIIYPLILAVASPALYELYSTFFEKRYSIFSVFLIIFSITYYAEIPQMARVMVAELFLALFLLSLITDNDYKLAIIFGLFLMLSHYSTFYFIFFELTIAIIITIFIKSPSRLQLTIVGMLSILSLSWFAVTSRGFVLKKVTRYLILIIKDTILLPKQLLFEHKIIKTSPVHIVSMKSPLLIQITKGAYALIALLLIVGVFDINLKKTNIEGENNKGYLLFYLLGVVNLCLIIALVLVPPVARTITSTRVFHLVLFISAPFVLKGAKKIIYHISRFKNYDYEIISVGLVIFLILSSGVLASFTKTPYDDTSIAFQPNTDWAKFNLGEIYAAQWVTTFWDKKGVKFLYADTYGWVLPGAFNWPHCSKFPSKLRIARTSYIFLRTWNIEHKNILYGSGRITGGEYIPLSRISKYLNDKIYSDNMAEVYLYLCVHETPRLTFGHCNMMKCVITR